MNNNQGIIYSDIVNEHTLNIFTDASIKQRKYRYDGCYGAIAVYNDEVIDEIYRVITDTTNNNAEIKGVRAGILLALKYQNMFKTINIFSDSQISIFGIRDRFLTWSLSPTGKLLGKTGQEILSQDIFLEIVYLILQYNLRVNFIHQKGHVTFKNDSLYKAQHVFRASNSIRGKIDMSIIRFISKWNNVVDDFSRSYLNRFNGDRLTEDPIMFFPCTIDRTRYKKLTENTIKDGVL